MVDTHGWAIRHVLGYSSVAPFSYTVGLTSRGWDELLITGLPADVADVFIRNAVDEQESRGPFQASDRTDALTESGTVVFIRVEDRSGLTAAERMLGDFDALQLVWPDSNDNFPWDIATRRRLNRSWGRRRSRIAPRDAFRQRDVVESWFNV
jgi:hypothetical protein